MSLKSPWIGRHLGEREAAFVCLAALWAAETCLVNVPKAFEVWAAANKGL